MTIKLADNNSLNFGFEIGAPLINLRQVLFRRFQIPLDLPLSFRADLLGETINLFDMNKSLYDYGKTDFKPMKLHMFQVQAVAGGFPGFPGGFPVFLDGFSGSGNCQLNETMFERIFANPSSTGLPPSDIVGNVSRDSAVIDKGATKSQVKSKCSSEVSEGSKGDKRGKSGGGLFRGMKKGFLSGESDKKQSVTASVATSASSTRTILTASTPTGVDALSLSFPLAHPSPSSSSRPISKASSSPKRERERSFGSGSTDGALHSPTQANSSPKPIFDHCPICTREVGTCACQVDLVRVGHALPQCASLFDQV